MPKISFTFSGQATGANIKRAWSHKEGWVDVSDWSAEELIEGLKKQEIFLSLTEESLLSAIDNYQFDDLKSVD